VLHEFVESRRAEIIARTKAKVAARAALGAPEADLTYGVPLFLDQLVASLKHHTLPSDEMNASAAKHGAEMLRLGFDVGAVVHDYGNVCQAVTELAFEVKAEVTVDEFHTMNRCLDDATAQAVTEHGRMRDKTMADQGTDGTGALASELRNRISTAMLMFSMLKAGTMTIRGSTGALHERSLEDLSALIDRLGR
jgi:hypothetical protein